MPPMDHDMVKRMSMGGESPSPECYATNLPFLQTLAFCISTHCESVETWEVEKWWETFVPGRMPSQPKPRLTYQQSLATIPNPPNSTTPADEMLSSVSLVSEEDYAANFNGDHTFEINDARHETYGLILITSGAIIPIALSCLRGLPLPRAFVSRFKAILIDPPLFSGRHRVPWFNSFEVPTRGQAIFIAYLVVANIVLSSVGYTISSPNSWYVDSKSQLANYIANRTGVLSAVNMALLVLYSGRNNILLWITDWSHSTFLLLHRWVAIISVVQACLHSAMYVQSYVVAYKEYTSESSRVYWIWGIISTLALTLLLPASVLPFRTKIYELFLAVHVFFACFALLGYYLHIAYRFGHQWGYETWVYIAFAFWAFDRLLRILRLARNGIVNGRVTIIDDDYVRLDVPGVSCNGQAYLYFPTLTWRVWENHPFSVASGMMTLNEGSNNKRGNIDEKSPSAAVQDPLSDDTSSTQSSDRISATTGQHKVGATFFIRTHTGLTHELRSRKTVPLLVESSYGKSLLFDPEHDLHTHPNLICIAGGVGITAVAPLLARHAGRKKLYWGVRTAPLADALRDTWETAAFAGLEKHIVVGDRLDLRAILGSEIAREAVGGEGTMIVVSGPAAMADEVRFRVSKLAGSEKAAIVTFVEESYSW
ncbi:uncharacterized protein LTR77_001892 [Saxophila tyrrhenica]|uniref:Ferric oxidoreductase domain-containing protein n=1 Tax=Saxophila tyrrhenica TaxID=1690608 RepID=A0AAV9PMS6_9PEZI|nr:hypothetical protein LTR77_001892 [Saxophila tyrrhenica]